MTLRPALQTLVYAALAALIGLAIGHAMFTMPRMLAAQAVADVFHAFMQPGAPPGWQGNALFHAIPSSLASIALWLGTVRE